MGFRRFMRKMGEQMPVFFIWFVCVVLAIGIHRLWVSPKRKTISATTSAKPDIAALQSMFTKDEIERMKKEYKASR